MKLIVALTVWLNMVVTVGSSNFEGTKRNIANVVENYDRPLNEETSTISAMPVNVLTDYILTQEGPTVQPVPLERYTDESLDQEKPTALPMPLERHTDESSGEETTATVPLLVAGYTDNTATPRWPIQGEGHTHDWVDQEQTATWPMPIEDFTARTLETDDFTVTGETFPFPFVTRMTQVVETEATTTRTNTNMPFNRTINSSWTIDSPAFRRPYTPYGPYYYDLFEIIPSTTGDYSFQSKSTIDTFGIVYSPNFDDSSPENNVFYSNDDGAGQGQFFIHLRLFSSNTYYLVATTYGLDAIADYQLIVKGSDAFTINQLTNSTLSMPNVSISSSLSNFHPQFNRPIGGSEAFYELYRLTVPTRGNYTVQCRSEFYNFIFIYSPSFNPASPSSNLIKYDDGYSSVRLTYDFRSSRQYYVVISSYYAQTTGNFTLLVKGSDLPNLTKLTNVTLTTRGINGILRRYRRYQRPGGAYPSYFYSVYQVIVRRSGYYIFSSNSTDDLIGYLYQNNFYAGQPTVNLLASDENGGGNGQFQFTTYLSSPRTYYFVVTTVERRVTAHFRLSVSSIITALLQPIQSKILTNATISSEWTMASDKFRRPAGFGRNHYYQAFMVTVSQKGLYSLICKSEVDSVGYMYKDDFNATSPYRNMLTYDDQHGANGVFGGNDQFGVTLILDSGVTYFLVATTYREFRFGSFDVVVQGEGQAAISPWNAKRR